MLWPTKMATVFSCWCPVYSAYQPPLPWSTVNGLAGVICIRLRHCELQNPFFFWKPPANLGIPNFPSNQHDNQYEFILGQDLLEWLSNSAFRC